MTHMIYKHYTNTIYAFQKHKFMLELKNHLNLKMSNVNSSDYTFSSLAADLRRGAAGFSWNINQPIKHTVFSINQSSKKVFTLKYFSATPGSSSGKTEGAMKGPRKDNPTISRPSAVVTGSGSHWACWVRRSQTGRIPVERRTSQRCRRTRSGGAYFCSTIRPLRTSL